MFSDWALANLGTIHDEPLFHKKWKFFGLFFNISCWGDEILKRKSLLKKPPMIKALTCNLHYVFKSLAFITTGINFFEAAFISSSLISWEIQNFCIWFLTTLCIHWVKGQLISKANFLALIWTKKRTKLFFDFCPRL